MHKDSVSCNDEEIHKRNETYLHVSLTVSESKRLIAKALAKSDFMRRAMQDGTVAIGPGTTNGYIVEEITGEPFDKRTFVTGKTLPYNYQGPSLSNTHPPLVLCKGRRVDIKPAEALKDMGPGDIYVKGVNAINYEKDQAAVLIGHPTGGGVGAAIGRIMARRICYLHPAGLEKNTPGDLNKVAGRLNRTEKGKGPTLWVVPGRIYTEIEALDDLCGVEAIPSAAGGIAGAEGAVWLAVFGDAAALEKVADLISVVRGEPSFGTGQEA